MKSTINLTILALVAVLAMGTASIAPLIAQEDQAVQEEFQEGSREKGKHGKRGMRGEREHRGKQGPHAFWRNEEAVDAVGLSEDQINTLEESFVQNEATVKALKEELTELRSAQKEISQGDDIDEEAIYENIDKAALVMAEIRKAQVSGRLLVKSTLDDEQLAALKDFAKSKMKEKRGQRGEGFEGRRGKRGGEGFGRRGPGGSGGPESEF